MEFTEFSSNFSREFDRDSRTCTCRRQESAENIRERSRRKSWNSSENTGKHGSKFCSILVSKSDLHECENISKLRWKNSGYYCGIGISEGKPRECGKGDHTCENRRISPFKNVHTHILRDLVVVIMLFMIFPSACCLDNNNILQLNIPTDEPVIDPNTICKTFPDLTRKQYRLCSKFPDVTASAIQGVQVAIYECQYQLREHRWNCSSLEKKNKNPHSSPLLRKGYRESAFAYALSSAGVTHQVSKACSMGKLKSCGCDLSMQGEVRDRFEWGGCSHNVDFGIKFAKKFTTAREEARDIHARINFHNNRAGRLMVMRNVKKQCKCHGMSGSCEIKTCWKVSPDFRIVGEKLKESFNVASEINLSNSADSRSKRRVIRKQPNLALLYYEKSPNFCDPNPNVDSPGTTGRLCNKTRNGVGNCDTLCCGRGYNTLKVRRTERCNCKFHWCCYVVCQTCTYNEWVTVCK